MALDFREELVNFIKQNSKGADFAVAKIVSVNETNATCSVKLLSDEAIELTEVQLRATQDNANTGLVAVPAVNSYVIIDIETNIVLMTSEISSLFVKIGNSTQKIDTNGFLIKKNNETLRAVISDLIDAIGLITVTTSGVVSTVPNNSASFTAIKTRLQSILTAS